MRPEKQLLLNEIKEKIGASKSMILTSYAGLTPNAAAELRMNLRKNGSLFTVVRKRVFLQATKAAGVTLDKEILQGHIGIVFAEEDVVTTAKEIITFSKNNENVLTVLGGQVEGQVCSAKDVEMLSELPSKDEMRAQLLGLFEAPMAHTLGVMEALLTSAIYCLDNKAKQENQS